MFSIFSAHGLATGTGVLDHMLLSSTETSRISEEVLFDEDVQPLSTEEDFSQHRRGEKRKRATTENGTETSVVAPSQRHAGGQTKQTRSSHLLIAKCYEFMLSNASSQDPKSLGPMLSEMR